MVEARENFFIPFSTQISAEKLEKGDNNDPCSFRSQDSRAEPDWKESCFLGLDHFRVRKAAFRADQRKDDGS